MEIGMTPRRPPVASDAEIRAYLLPRLRARKPPSLRAMRADLGGGGFSRLVRMRREIEAELAGDAVEPDRAGEPVGADELVATLEALLERQWKALEERERKWPNLGAAPTADIHPLVTKARKRPGDEGPQADRLEAAERRLTTAIAKLENIAKGQQPASAPGANPVLEDVPPAWARQAAAAAAAALDGRLQSMEESVRDAAEGGKAAFDMAAEIARDVAADASLQLHVARSTLSRGLKEELAPPERSSEFDDIRRMLETLRHQVGTGFSTAAEIADRRAAAITEVIIGMTDIEIAQFEMALLAVAKRSPKQSQRRPMQKRRRRAS